MPVPVAAVMAPLKVMASFPAWLTTLTARPVPLLVSVPA